MITEIEDNADLAEQLIAVRGDLRTHADVAEQLWLERGKIDSKLGTLAQFATKHDSFLNDIVWPAVKDGMAANDEVSRQLPRILAQLEQVDRTLQAFDGRLRSLELEMGRSSQRWDSTHEAALVRLEANETQTRKQEVRLAQLEQDQTISKALAKTARRKSAGIATAIGAVVGGAVSALAKALM
jgi:adenylate kinase family enzyme